MIYTYTTKYKKYFSNLLFRQATSLCWIQDKGFYKNALLNQFHHFYTQVPKPVKIVMAMGKLQFSINIIFKIVLSIWRRFVKNANKWLNKKTNDIFKTPIHDGYEKPSPNLACLG